MSTDNDFEDLEDALTPPPSNPPPPHTPSNSSESEDSEEEDEEEVPQQPMAQAQATGAKVEIPKFTGEGPETSEDCRAWLTAIEEYFAAVRVPAEEQPRQVTFAFRPPSCKAYKWWTKTLQRDRTVTGSWDAAKRAIREQFYARSTPAEVATLFRNLQMKGDEDVKSFLDRIDDAMLIAEQEYPGEIQGLNAAQYRASLQAYIETQTRLYFISGLTPKLAVDVLKQEFTTLADAKRVAERAETALKNEKKQEYYKTQVVAEVGGNFSNAEEEVAALQSRIEQIQFQNRGRGGGRGQRGRGFQTNNRGRGNFNNFAQNNQGGARPRNPLGRPVWLRNDMLPENTCYRCGHQGHLGRSCTTPEAQYNWTNLARAAQQSRQVAEVQLPQQNNTQQMLTPQAPPTQALPAPQFTQNFNTQQQTNFRKFEESNEIHFQPMNDY